MSLYKKLFLLGELQIGDKFVLAIKQFGKKRYSRPMNPENEVLTFLKKEGKGITTTVLCSDKDGNRSSRWIFSNVWKVERIRKNVLNLQS
jgi:hypothetical protein